VLAVLNSERFCDHAPAQVWATLLDEGTYLASISTMYRILRTEHQVRERRRQARHPARVKPELMADAPNQVWSWDITKLAGPHKWNWFHCYVILDIYSRLAVGWVVAPTESAALAEELIDAACTEHGINRHQLHLHVSNDNPYSESQFKTLKHSPRFPDRFVSLAHARTFINDFFDHYNQHHHHSGIGYHTPADVHTGRHHQIQAARQTVLDHAYNTNPHRFHKRPTAPKAPNITWINQPDENLSHRDCQTIGVTGLAVHVA
jgi:putative transposase